MQKIVLIPIKDEAWILESSLAHHSLWADKIIVADQNSNDNSREICAKFPKVILIKNPSQDFNEADRRQILLDEVRKKNTKSLIFALDADEIMSADILNEQVMNLIEENAKNGYSISLPWIQVLEDCKNYDASFFKKERKCFIYYDDGKDNFQKGFIHLSRVPEEKLKKRIELDNPVVLHLQKCDKDRFKAKQRYYNLIEKISGKSKSNLKNDLIYSVNYLKEKKRKMPEVWLKNYQKAGINIKINKAEYFFDRASMDLIKNYGAENFKNLNIWDHDKWPEIKDPRNYFLKKYQNFKHHHITAITFFITMQVAKIIFGKNKTV